MQEVLASGQVEVSGAHRPLQHQAQVALPGVDPGCGPQPRTSAACSCPDRSGGSAEGQWQLQHSGASGCMCGQTMVHHLMACRALHRASGCPGLLGETFEFQVMLPEDEGASLPTRRSAAATWWDRACRWASNVIDCLPSRCRNHSQYVGVRVGEASHPGPVSGPVFDVSNLLGPGFAEEIYKYIQQAVQEAVRQALQGLRGTGTTPAVSQAPAPQGEIQDGKGRKRRKRKGEGEAQAEAPAQGASQQKGAQNQKGKDKGKGGGSFLRNRPLQPKLRSRAAELSPRLGPPTKAKAMATRRSRLTVRAGLGWVPSPARRQIRSSG